MTSSVIVEQGSPFLWERYLGNCGPVIGRNALGSSPPHQQLQAGDTTKACMPQHGRVEQPLDRTPRAGPDLLPSLQTALGARQEMCEGGTEWEDDARIESRAVHVKQTDLPQ